MGGWCHNLFIYQKSNNKNLYRSHCYFCNNIPTNTLPKPNWRFSNKSHIWKLFDLEKIVNQQTDSPDYREDPFRSSQFQDHQIKVKFSRTNFVIHRYYQYFIKIDWETFTQYWTRMGIVEIPYIPTVPDHIMFKIIEPTMTSLE